jgi:hypothetical protein
MNFVIAMPIAYRLLRLQTMERRQVGHEDKGGNCLLKSAINQEVILLQTLCRSEPPDHRHDAMLGPDHRPSPSHRRTYIPQKFKYRPSHCLKHCVCLCAF